LKVVNLRGETRNGRRAARAEVRLGSGIKQVKESGGEFSGGPGAVDVLQVLVRGAVVYLHVAIGFLTVLVNDVRRDNILERFLPPSLPGEARHELLTNEVGKLLGKRHFADCTSSLPIGPLTHSFSVTPCARRLISTLR